ncbi:hypothetical protein Q2T83_06700 [Fervidibacter sacchari]|uniref:Uncharacterized protein n=1 Tax=Candidatus Fervidibacter sacchari TaxID=1448929 RepID=A0ABT2EPD0_9BACT|nr:hypothetical protein [Candidatus Fervidibacter sacchari]MCS3918745.1 hypothetical protein [Candidatus Fervidibacter sacchari]WKU17505.1 hypothetical protein Q2T83_06700 [Candidatus Fervidibacter sacchari]
MWVEGRLKAVLSAQLSTLNPQLNLQALACFDFVAPTLGGLSKLLLAICYSPLAVVFGSVGASPSQISLSLSYSKSAFGFFAINYGLKPVARKETLWAFRTNSFCRRSSVKGQSFFYLAE